MEEVKLRRGERTHYILQRLAPATPGLLPVPPTHGRVKERRCCRLQELSQSWPLKFQSGLIIRIEKGSWFQKAVSPGLRVAFTLRHLASGDSYKSSLYSFRVVKSISKRLPDHHSQPETMVAAWHNEAQLGDIEATAWHNSTLILSQLDYKKASTLGNMPIRLRLQIVGIRNGA